jgi:hypothetical protein
MKKYAAFVASVAFSGAMLVGCGGEDDFCAEAKDVGAQALQGGDVDLQDLVDKAPDEIKDDYEVIMDGGDQQAMQDAAANIATWTQDNCD